MFTTELTGTALDWAVAKSKGIDFEIDLAILIDGEIYCPSAEWSDGGPIIDNYGISIEFTAIPGANWFAHIDGLFEVSADTALMAAMRCFVFSKLGKEVELPEGVGND